MLKAIAHEKIEMLALQIQALHIGPHSAATQVPLPLESHLHAPLPLLPLPPVHGAHHLHGIRLESDTDLLVTSFHRKLQGHLHPHRSNLLQTNRVSASTATTLDRLQGLQTELGLLRACHQEVQGQLSKGCHSTNTSVLLLNSSSDENEMCQ